MDANALGRMRVRIHSYILSDAFASLSAFTKISRILCVRIRIPDRILIPVLYYEIEAQSPEIVRLVLWVRVVTTFFEAIDTTNVS